MDFLNQYPSMDDVQGITLTPEDTKRKYDNQPTKLQKYAMNLEKQERFVDAVSIQEDALRNNRSPEEYQARFGYRQVPIYKWKTATKFSTKHLTYDSYYTLLDEVFIKIEEHFGTLEEFRMAVGREPSSWEYHHMQIEVI